MFCLFMGTALARMPPSAVGSKATGYVGATLRGIRSWTSLAFLATPATGGSIPSEANVSAMTNVACHAAVSDMWTVWVSRKY